MQGERGGCGRRVRGRDSSVLADHSVWTQSPLSLGLPLATYTTSRVYDSAHQPHTAVDMKISVPTGLLFQYTTYNMVTSGLLGSGKVYAAKYGKSGTPVHLYFTLQQA